MCCWASNAPMSEHCIFFALLCGLAGAHSHISFLLFHDRGRPQPRSLPFITRDFPKIDSAFPGTPAWGKPHWGTYRPSPGMCTGAYANAGISLVAERDRAHPPFSQPSIFPRQLSDPRLRRPRQRRTASIDLADGSTVIVDTATWASTACCHAVGPDRRSQSEVLGRFSVRLAAGHVSFLGLAAQPAQPDRCGDPFAVGCRPRR